MHSPWLGIMRPGRKTGPPGGADFRPAGGRISSIPGGGKLKNRGGEIQKVNTPWWAPGGPFFRPTNYFLNISGGRIPGPSFSRFRSPGGGFPHPGGRISRAPGAEIFPGRGLDFRPAPGGRGVRDKERPPGPEPARVWCHCSTLCRNDTTPEPTGIPKPKNVSAIEHQCKISSLAFESGP